jgi:hypothetical protein
MKQCPHITYTVLLEELIVVEIVKINLQMLKIPSEYKHRNVLLGHSEGVHYKLLMKLNIRMACAGMAGQYDRIEVLQIL